MIIELLFSRHVDVRAAGRENYLRTQGKRQKIYHNHLEEMSRQFQNGGLVGVRIDRVDRSNCDAKLLPCIIENRIDNLNIPRFRLICQYGRLSTSFPVHHLIRMNTPIPLALAKIDRDKLPTISIVQACKMFARCSVVSTCDCKTKCVKNSCPCRRNSVKCSTKCHSRRGKCDNFD